MLGLCDMYQYYSGQETIPKDTNSREMEPGKELLTEHILKNNKLEARIVQLENESEMLREELVKQEYKNYQSVKSLTDYESFIKKSIDELKKVNNEKNLVRTHLAKLEVSFRDLIEKYERAKTIVFGYEDNEKILKDYILHLENCAEVTNERYEDLRQKFAEYVQEGNIVIKQKEENYLQELFKLKSKPSQSQLKIGEVENCNVNGKLILEPFYSDVN